MSSMDGMMDRMLRCPTRMWRPGLSPAPAPAAARSGPVTGGRGALRRQSTRTRRDGSHVERWGHHRIPSENGGVVAGFDDQLESPGVFPVSAATADRVPARGT